MKRKLKDTVTRIHEVYPKLEDLQALAATAQSMVDLDARVCRDAGTCVIGAGIAVYAIPKGCRKPQQCLLTDAPFQGNVGSYNASKRALEWLKSQGVEAYWYDGRMD